MRSGDNSTDLNTVKEIFEKSNKSTDHFIDLIKLTKNDKFANFKKYNVDSEEPELYLEGIN